MTWYAWVLVGVVVVSSLLTVAMIGKPRKPIDPPSAVFILIVNALVVWGIVSLALR